MNTEDFVTYKQAVNLKELGFDWYVNHYYDEDGEVIENLIETTEDSNYDDFNNGYEDEKNYCSAPTLVQAQKWLREKYNYIIELISLSKTIWTGKYTNCNLFQNGYKIDINIYSSYEEVLTKCIDTCIEEIKSFIERKEINENISQLNGKYICYDGLKYKDYLHVSETITLFEIEFQPVCGLMVDEICYFNKINEKYVYKKLNDGNSIMYEHKLPIDFNLKKVTGTFKIINKDEFNEIIKILVK